MSALPTGTVTFLFSDIEGSSRLWEQCPNAMPPALARHDALLHQAVEEAGGSVFKMTGDGICAVFGQAGAAVRAALAAQQALCAEPWPLPEPGALRVRLALHTGAAEERAGDYFGITLSRTERLLNAAHGGQILLSETTGGLAAGLLPSETLLLSLGQHRLRDFPQPQTVFQLRHPALPAEFPPLRSLAASHNLPGSLTSFVGREREMAQARRRLSASRLLTLTGPGGAGKTRLALELAAETLEAFPDGVRLVELAALTDPALVPQAVASALSVREEPERLLPETLQAFLQPKTALLVLDNCEHLLDACARLAHTLLRACPQLKILATSREALGIGGEETLTVPSLSLPKTLHLPVDDLAQCDAVRLFVDRAASALPTFRFSAGNADAVTQVCRRLDGIPLLLELAAARVRSLSCEQIAQRLDDSFRLLTGGSRTALPRQQTLRAAIDWSYDLLTEAERILLRRLSVFAGGWTLDAAEAVCAGDGLEAWDVLDLLSRLVDKSLVQMEESDEGDPRYRLLETLRQYALERLEETQETDRLTRRHQDWCLAFAEQAAPNLTGPEQVEWLNRLEREHDNLRAALGCCERGHDSATDNLRLGVALYLFWYLHGYLSEGRGWLTRALTRSADAPDALRATALSGAGVLAGTQGDYAVARSLHEESLRLRREIGDRSAIARSLNNLGMIANAQGDEAFARSCYEQSLTLSRELGDTPLMAIMLGNLGALAIDRADYAAATPFLTESLALRRALHDSYGIASVLHNLGEAAYKQGNVTEALQLSEESLKGRQILGDKFGMAQSLYQLGLISSSIAQDSRALQLLGAAEAGLAAVSAPLSAADQAEIQACLETLRARLTPEAYAAGWAQGIAMPLEHAVAFALRNAEL